MQREKQHTYFISEHLHREAFHGSIGNVDIEKILLQKGYQPLQFKAGGDASFLAGAKRFFYLVNCFFAIPAGSRIVFQFALLSRAARLLLRLLKYKNRVTAICFIADIDGIKNGNDALLQQEIIELRRFSYFIVHNQKMKEWLQQIVPGSFIAEIEFFDFLGIPSNVQRNKSTNLVFAGNLEKSAFLAKLQPLNPGLQFLIYGPGITGAIQNQSNVQYKGVYEPYTLIDQLQGSFGLVWDGESIDGCKGSLGIYMAYISHHKLSLYLLAGLPVITAKKAASAYLVEKYKVGFAVNNLYEIAGIINNMNEETYRTMANNTRRLGAKIAQGKCLEKALELVEKEIAGSTTL